MKRLDSNRFGESDSTQGVRITEYGHKGKVGNTSSQNIRKVGKRTHFNYGVHTERTVVQERIDWRSGHVNTISYLETLPLGMER